MAKKIFKRLHGQFHNYCHFQGNCENVCIKINFVINVFFSTQAGKTTYLSSNKNQSHENKIMTPTHTSESIKKWMQDTKSMCCNGHLISRFEPC